MSDVTQSVAQLRATLFASTPPVRETFQLNGHTIEIQLPLTGEVLPYSAGTKKLNPIDILIDFAYFPGSTEKLFNEADKDQLALMPYDISIQNIYLRLLKLITGISVDDAVKNLNETSLNKIA